MSHLCVCCSLPTDVEPPGPGKLPLCGWCGQHCAAGEHKQKPDDGLSSGQLNGRFQRLSGYTTFGMKPEDFFG